MICGKQIPLSSDGRRVTYCMKETSKTDPKTGVLYHDGPCEAWDGGRVYRAYDPKAITTEAPVAKPIEVNSDPAPTAPTEPSVPNVPRHPDAV